MSGSSVGQSRFSRAFPMIFARVMAIVALAVYWLTAYPTITWWDSSAYSIAAATRGITTPPGSFLLVVLGWLATRLPLGLPAACVLNLLAGLFAAITVELVFLVACRLIRYGGNPGRMRSPRSLGPPLMGAAFGALVFGFSETLWLYAVQFTPYVLTVLFTGLIVWAMLRWWENASRPGAWRWLLLLGILFGLDFSVHRTNLLLLPGFLIWILLRHPRTLFSARCWISGISGAVAGLAFHFLIIPISAGDPVLNMGEPSTLARFYDYVSLKQYGGSWLVKFYPRNAPFWSAQVADLLSAFRANFLTIAGPLKVVGLLPALFGALGLLMLWLRNRRLAVAFALLLLAHAVITILYFNIPEDFFRSLHRHYLPVFTVFAILLTYGFGVSVRGLWEWRGPQNRYLAGLFIGLLALVPLSQLLRNWEAVDGSEQYFAADFAANTLNGLPPDAILFTNGDNDTWPLLYMQAVENVRPDVDVLNLPLTNTPWFVEQIVRRNPGFPLCGAPTEFSARAWSDTTITIPVVGVPGQFGLPDTLPLPGSINIDAEPTFGGQYVLGQDLVLLQIVKDNQWRRPICFAVTVSSQNRQWMNPYCRMEGLALRIVPWRDPLPDTAILRHNLCNVYSYRGYSDPSIPLERVTRSMGANLYHGFMELGHTYRDRGDTVACQQTNKHVLELLPPSRLEPSEELRDALTRLCAPPEAESAAP